jgi:hypothetical protein
VAESGVLHRASSATTEAHCLNFTRSTGLARSPVRSRDCRAAEIELSTASLFDLDDIDAQESAVNSLQINLQETPA